MRINTSTFVLADVVETAAGVPQSRALPIALFASTLRPMMGLLFALLLGKSALATAPSSSSSTVTPSGGGTTTSTGTKAPVITALAKKVNELLIKGENFGTIKHAVTVKFSWPVGSHEMTTLTMPLARHKSDLKDDLITIPMSELPRAANRSTIAVVVFVNSVASNSKNIDL